MNDELCIIFLLLYKFTTGCINQSICAQMGERLRFILKNRKPPVSFFVSACKGTQSICQILIKLRTVVVNVNFVGIILKGIYVPEAAATVKRVLNGTRIGRNTAFNG